MAEAPPHLAEHVLQALASVVGLGRGGGEQIELPGLVAEVERPHPHPGETKATPLQLHLLEQATRGLVDHLGLRGRRRQGELPVERLNAIWMEVQREILGPAINLSEGYETWWVYISHFIHAPFYVYAYAFGDCLVNSLYARYRESAVGFQDKYFAMLRAGGSKHHKELLAPFGLDAADPAFWQKGLGVVERLIDELEAIDAA